MDHNYHNFLKFHSCQIPQSEQQQQQAQQGGYAWMPGATTVGVVFNGGVILAAEKRVTYGYFIMSKGGKKVFKVTDRIGVACAGLVGDMQIFAKEMEVQANLLQHGCRQKNQCTFSI